MSKRPGRGSRTLRVLARACLLVFIFPGEPLIPEDARDRFTKLVVSCSYAFRTHISLACDKVTLSGI